jgi:hypothetical protein
MMLSHLERAESVLMTQRSIEIAKQKKEKSTSL